MGTCLRDKDSIRKQVESACRYTHIAHVSYSRWKKRKWNEEALTTNLKRVRGKKHLQKHERNSRTPDNKSKSKRGQMWERLGVCQWQVTSMRQHGMEHELEHRYLSSHIHSLPGSPCCCRLAWCPIVVFVNFRYVLLNWPVVPTWLNLSTGLAPPLGGYTCQSLSRFAGPGQPDPHLEPPQTGT